MDSNNPKDDFRGTGEKSGEKDKKSPQQGGNVVLYVLGLAVLVLLIVIFWQSGSQLALKSWELTKLLEASSRSNPEHQQSINIERGSDEKKTRYRISKLDDLVIGPYTVSGKLTKQAVPLPTVSNRANEAGNSKQLKPEVVEFTANCRPEKDSVYRLLEETDIHYDDQGGPSALSQYGPMLAFTALFVVFLFFLMRRMGGAGSPMAFGRSRGKLYAQEDIEITFDDVAGVDEAVEELREVVEFLRTPEKYQVLGGRIPKGVLLVGPPGTGKTLLAKAIAGEAGVPFFSLSGSDFVEMFVGVGAARVRDMFQQAEQRAPSIIFIDELDALGKTRGGEHGGRT